jgi:hypothetical protein
VVWIRTGNSRITTIENILRKYYIKIREVIDKEKHGVIEIE